jgi:hypothetical protein
MTPALSMLRRWTCVLLLLQPLLLPLLLLPLLLLPLLLPLLPLPQLVVLWENRTLYRQVESYSAVLYNV